jgi:hypothetical protein
MFAFRHEQLQNYIASGLSGYIEGLKLVKKNVKIFPVQLNEQYL